MKKKIKNSKPFLKKRKKLKKVKQTGTILGLGPKMVNSIILALEEDDKIHVRKIVEGLSEYDLAKLIEVLDHNQRRQLIEILGSHINPDVFPELNEVVQEQVIDSLDENQIVHIVNELDSDEAVEILEHHHQPSVSRAQTASQILAFLSGRFRRAYYVARVCQYAGQLDG